jgi:hypothetical protein
MAVSSMKEANIVYILRRFFTHALLVISLSLKSPSRGLQFS